jgi:PIN domain nuclease of toxin-antitoxin system
MILLDTHAAVWLASDQSKLSVEAFDRVLIALCQANEWTLLSKDKLIAKYPDIHIAW